MMRQSTARSQTFRVRPIEARDFTAALELFPGAMMHLRRFRPHAGAKYGSSVASARQNAWVAEAEDRLIGMAVLSIESPILAHLTYLHVAGDCPDQAPAAQALARIAIREAWHTGFLKLVVHTQIPATQVINYMHGLGLLFSRNHFSGRQQVVEFYRNLYELPREPSSEIEHLQRGVNLRSGSLSAPPVYLATDT